MASKNTTKTSSYLEVEELEEPKFEKQVQSNYPGRVIVTTPLGNRYVWEKGGDVLVIENEFDFDYIIRKELPKSCCGSRVQQFMFLEINSEVLL